MQYELMRCIDAFATIKASFPCVKASLSGIESISNPCDGVPFFILISDLAKFVSKRCK